MYSLIAAFTGIALPYAAVVALAAGILAVAGQALALVVATGGHLEILCIGLNDWVGGCFPYFSWGDDMQGQGLVNSLISMEVENILQERLNLQKL